jgi:uncharacterized membrane-anchored protein YhcB (DUF1043 family)
MKCEEVEALVIDYLENKLETNQAREIEKHFETCEHCLDSMMEIQQVMHALSKDKMAEPDDSLRINFYHMLHNEIKKKKERSPLSLQKRTSWWHNLNLLRIAAGIALLICGTFIGAMINSRLRSKSQEVELSQLQAEVSSMKQAAMFTMLKDESSSYRIQGINYTDEIQKPDDNVIEALLMTLNNDKNVNVRLAAAFALAKYAEKRSVCDSLVKSLSVQTEPILQITLINILVERDEKSALKLIQQISTNNGTLEEVKHVAENGARKLML